MRIVHTADWHVGRVWKNLNRQLEMEAVLDHLVGFLLSQRIDLLLMAGDVFENVSPTADAERLVFRFFKRIGQAGVQAVVIAGNHDSAARIEAWGMLAELVGVRTVGRPRRADQGGVLEVATRSGECAVVAALPFAHVRTWVSALELAGDETQARQRYADGFRAAIQHLTQSFRTDAVNLIMAHTHLDGAAFGSSERQVHLGEEWAATPQVIPAAASYVALGHIHQPQRIEAAPAPTYYAGSPLQLDFGEAGQAKTFLLIEAIANRPVKVEAIPYEGGRPLLDLKLTLPEIAARADELKTAGHLRVTVPLDLPDADLNRKVRHLLPNALIVSAELPQLAPAAVERPGSGASPLDLYRAYHRRRHQEDPAAQVEAAFLSLYQEVGG